jgi:branched-chain amino acid transport system substrate-binding protein
LALSASACTSSGGSAGGAAAGQTGGAAAGQTFNIGGAFALTGPQTAYGTLWQKVGEGAAAYVNSHHLINGQIKFTAVDDQASAGPAVTAVHQLIDVDHVMAVITQSSAPTAAMAPIAERSNVLLFNPGAASPTLAGLSPYLFNLIPLGQQQVAAVVPYVVKHLNVKRWGILYSNETLGNAMLKALNTTLLSLGATVVARESVDATDTTFSSQVAALAAAKPDAVFYANTNGPNYPTFLKEEEAAGLKALNVTYAGPEVGLTATPLPTAAIYPTQLQGSGGSDAAGLALLKIVPTPDTETSNLFNAVLLFAQAIAQLQKDGKQVTGAGLQNLIAHGTYTAANETTYSFNTDGTLKNPPISIDRIQNGKAASLSGSGQG